MSNKVDRRVLRTRQLLRTALLSLIQERDFDSLTVQDITERATLNRATFYLHYADKHDLLLQVIRETLVELTDLPLPHNHGESARMEPENLRIFFIAVFQHVITNLTFYRVMLQTGGIAGVSDEIHATIYKVGMWMIGRSETIHWRVPPEVIMSMISGAYLGMVRWAVMQPSPPSPQHLASQFIEVMMPGIFNAIDG